MRMSFFCMVPKPSKFNIPVGHLDVRAAAEQRDVLVGGHKYMLFAGGDFGALVGLDADGVVLRLQQQLALVGNTAGQ